MITRKQIIVRYLKDNNNLSRPHRIRKEIDTESNICNYYTMNYNRKIEPNSFVTDWDNKNVSISNKEVTVLRVKLLKTESEENKRYTRPINVYEVTMGDGSLNYIRVNAKGKGIPIKGTIITDWKKGPTPFSSPIKLNRSYSSKDISKLVVQKIASSRDSARELLERYGHISKVPEYNVLKIQTKNVIKRITCKPVGSLNELCPNVISKKKPNVRKFLHSKVEKKYAYLKQALGMKEITLIQFTILMNHFIPIEYQTFIIRKKKEHKERIARNISIIRARMVKEALDQEDGTPGRQTFIKLPLGTRNKFSPDIKEKNEKPKEEEVTQEV
jgi:hypothetical protein